jgi:CshA-type fibril repeat protein
VRISGILKLAVAAVVVPVLAGSPAVASPGTAPLTSTGAGLQKQTVTVAVPAGWRMGLAGRDPRYVHTVVVPQGFYTRDSATAVTFTPALGYLGTPAPATIRVTGPGGQVRVHTYTPTVTRPPAPPAPDLTSRGSARAAQSVTFPIPAGGSIDYADPTTTVPQGVYALAAASSIATVPGRPFDPTLIGAIGTVIFTPARGATGAVPSIRYRVTDAYRQTSIGRYTPTVTGYFRATPSFRATPQN